jgi:RNA recognition motif-containing protein
MAVKLFVGSLPYSINDQSLEELFTQFGAVESAKVILDRDNNNRSKGFGFVEMTNDDEAKAAIEALNNKEVEGRTIVVNEARPREDRGGDRRSGGGGGFGGGNRSSGGGGGGRGFGGGDRRQNSW